MQLVNETRLPDEVLRPLLAAAAREAKAHTTGVLVRVRWGWRDSNASGDTIRWRSVQRGKKRLRGHIEIVCRRASESLAFAAWFWGIAVHEWHHIAWRQQGNVYDDRDAYREREYEIEAFACQHRAEEKQSVAVQDMILALALAREALKKK